MVGYVIYNNLTNKIDGNCVSCSICQSTLRRWYIKLIEIPPHHSIKLLEIPEHYELVRTTGSVSGLDTEVVHSREL